MRLLRILTGGMVACVLVVGSVLPTAAQGKAGLEFTKLWTHGHPAIDGQLSEIPAFDPKTRTLWVVGVVGVDVLDLATGDLVEHIDVTPHGAVNGVAIFNGLAAFAVEAKSQSAACPSTCDRRNPGKVLFYDTVTRQLADGVTEVLVGSLPDMLTFTHDGSKLLVVNEATPNVRADAGYATPDPVGSVTIIDTETRTVIATAVPPSLGTSGTFLRLASATGMDFEPEYIAVSHDGTKAFVTLQEANGLGVLDLTSNEFTEVIGLGAKDFNVTGNEIDPKQGDGVTFQKVAAKGLYMPDSMATYKVRGTTYLVMANEGDFREDNVDRVAAGATAPLDTLRVVKDLKDAGTGLFAAGARSFSIRTTDGALVYDSKSILDRAAHALGLYDDGRSRDKGVEPEGVALLEVGSQTFAFIGLERTLKSAVAVFDITNPASAAFLQLIVTDGDLGPEGLTTFKSQGQDYLAIANEVVASGKTTSNTTLYRVDAVKK